VATAAVAMADGRIAPRAVPTTEAVHA